MKEPLTRERALELHRQMWGDMQAELGDNPPFHERVTFKKKWLEKYFPNEHVNSNCILCEYAQHVTKVSFTRCRKCPIVWNSNLDPTCTPGIWAVWNDDEVDYRYSPISVILALPEREVEK